MSVVISTEPKLLDVEWTVEKLRGTYWGEWLTAPQIKSAIEKSVVFGVYRVSEGGRKQIGFARVVSDWATFSSIMDVFIDEANRRHGIGTMLMQQIITHPSVVGTICILATRDARGFYERFGFGYEEDAIMKRVPGG